MINRLLPKAKGEVYVGILPSESNPPTRVEFLDALKCMAKFALDKIVYTVIDGDLGDGYFKETRKHRLSMAKSDASIFSPLIEVADVGDGEPCAGEEAAFRLFDLNPDLKFTMAYISPATTRSERAHSIERPGSNIGMRLHGFNSSLHKIVALFRGDDHERLCGVEDVVSQYVDEGLFGVECLSTKEDGLPRGMIADKILLSAVSSHGDVTCPLLSSGVARYITQNDDYRRRLAAHLSNRDRR